MKEIKAYIKPHKLSDVLQKLHVIDGLTGVTVIDVKGFGRGRGKQDHEHIVENYAQIPHVKIEIVCKNELVDHIVDTIEKAAHTGLRGDGIIYVTPVETVIRISTGEHDEKVF